MCDFHCLIKTKALFLKKNHIIMIGSIIGQTIKQTRKKLGITQSDLAELASVSKNTLYKLERGLHLMIETDYTEQ